tara:strand:+ start:6744 stop:6941 length:198 start_codon:yes stop_codon:yes gene_type:complete
MDEQKRHLQVLQIQLQTLSDLPAVKKFLELQEKAEMVNAIIKQGETTEEKGQDAEGLDRAVESAP